MITLRIDTLYPFLKILSVATVLEYWCDQGRPFSLWRARFLVGWLEMSKMISPMV